MSKLQETLNTLSPYVTGIRQVEGVTLVDIQLKDGWKLLDSNYVQRAEGDGINHYILFSENKNTGLDDILTYLSGVIQGNREREEKITLLKEKILELKSYFLNYSLKEVKTLKFVIGIQKEDFLELEETPIEIQIEQPETIQQEPQQTIQQTQQPLTNEDLEYMEEEKRAANYLKLKKAGKVNLETLNKSPVQEDIPRSVKTCKCVEGEACGLCVDYQ